ncbi:hypothetical protein [Chelativorans sp. AA-79]|uniref:hypothetical protein n=1 Tax=Chelativorans sp. AA-79 TaxID=3028735 RepID=UPI0023F835CD|nr:hypothetical protein [Chelativorans sp. AA-79]WEX10304.1 hypothetical protein PVE73_04920 [Chelativorans sp. AA-79]
MARLRETLPTDEEGIVEEAGRSLERYHDAALANDVDGQGREVTRLNALIANVWQSPPGERYRGSERFDCWHSAADWLLDQTAARDGDVPMYGQRGRFVLEIAGCRTDFRYDGIFGICGGGAHVIDLDRPFYSETGFRSFQVCPHHRILCTGGIDVDDYMARVCEAQLRSAQGIKGDRPIKLHEPPFGPLYWRGNQKFGPDDGWIRERRNADPAWRRGGFLAELPDIFVNGIGVKVEASGQMALVL